MYACQEGRDDVGILRKRRERHEIPPSPVIGGAWQVRVQGFAPATWHRDLRDPVPCGAGATPVPLPRSSVDRVLSQARGLLPPILPGSA